jgi:DnaJ-class molecular chaperone
MKICRKCSGYGYLPGHKNKPLRICKKCDGWGKTTGYSRKAVDAK